jgi:glycosyltransferase involved in cell wall biosynthesis
MMGAMPPSEQPSADARPPVSVVIPTYNRAVTLDRAIRSVLAQEWPLELIVVDDGSDDETRSVVEAQSDPRIRYERQPRNLGAAAARRRGIETARFEWVALLDSDDYWLPRKLELQMAALLRDRDSRQLAYHAVFARGPGWGRMRPTRGLGPMERVGDYLFRRGGLIRTSTMCARREHFLEYGFDPTLPRYQDWDLCLRMEAAGFRFTWIPQTLAVWSCEPRPERLSHPNGDDTSRRWLERVQGTLAPAARRCLRAEFAVRGALTWRRRAAALRHVAAAGLTGASSAAHATRLLARLVLPARWVDVARRATYGGAANQLEPPRRPRADTRVEAARAGARAPEERPLVSVIVPVLNDEPGIWACLDALCRQTYPPERCEIVVADNGSRDGTRAAVERFAASSAGRVRLVVEAEMRSSYAARNRALHEARGEIIALTDADCTPAAEWIERGVVALERQGSGAIAGRVTFSYREDRPNACEYWDSAVHIDQESFVRRYGFGATANLFTYARMFDRYGPFRPDLISGGDREFGHRLWLGGEPIGYAADAVVRHPARATMRAALGKSLRLARAHRPLHDLGALRSRVRCIRQLRPFFSCPPPRSWDGRLSRTGWVGVLVLRNLDAWLTALVCLGQAASDGLRARGGPRRGSAPG